MGRTYDGSADGRLSSAGVRSHQPWLRSRPAGTSAVFIRRAASDVVVL